ncbi:MAG: peptidase U32 family protein [Adlercreutzia equolifaciens]
MDAFIIGDLGAFAVAGEVAPRVERHVSTQASVANAAAARVWHSLGASRVVCAREMSLADIARLRQDAPPDLEIEAFAHGAMCMAVSGRCLISSYLTGRSGNKGHCTQPCRWSYQLGTAAFEEFAAGSSCGIPSGRGEAPRRVLPHRGGRPRHLHHEREGHEHARASARAGPRGS